MEDHISSSSSSSSPVQERSSKPLNLISVARKTLIPVLGSENWPSLADSLLKKRANLKDEKQTKPTEVRGSIVPPAANLPSGGDAITIPPVSHSIATNTHKGQGSALPLASAFPGSSNACVAPVSSSVMTTSADKGQQSNVTSASARPIHSNSLVTNTHKARPDFDFQPHRGHPPMQARLPGPWAVSGFNQICHPPWPPVYTSGNANMWYPEGYFGNFPNGVGNHLQGPNVDFNHTQQHQQAFNSLYDINMHRPIIPWTPVMQASPFINPAPWFRNEPNFHVPSPASGVPTACPEPARVSAGCIQHPQNYETQTQASEQPPSLRIRIVKQIEYYFSDENLPRDYYLRKLMDKDGWVEISKVVEFNRVRNMTINIPFILDALRSSNLVEVQSILLGIWSNTPLKGGYVRLAACHETITNLFMSPGFPAATISQVNRIRRRDNWPKWVQKPILSLPEESKNPEGHGEDITVVNPKNHQSSEDDRIEDKTIVDLKNHQSSEDDQIEVKIIDVLKKHQSSEDVQVEDKTIDGQKEHQSSKDNTQKDSQQRMDFSSIADSLAVMVSKLSLEDDSEKVLSTGDESMKKMPNLLGSSQFIRCF